MIRKYSKQSYRNAESDFNTSLSITEKRTVINPETKQFNLSRIFTLGEFKAIQVLREQVRDQMCFDENGQPIQENRDTLIKV